jgi:hypothetical protein
MPHLAALLLAQRCALVCLPRLQVTPAERMLLLAASRHHDSAGKHAPPDSDAQLSVEGQQLETPSAASPAADGVVRACEPASGGTAAQAHSKCHQQQLAALVRAAGSTCLQHAARTCGVDVGVGSAHDCSDQTHGVVATGTAAARATSRAGAAAVLASPSGSTACWDAEGVFTAFISEEELRAKYLWAERARLAARCDGRQLRVLVVTETVCDTRHLLLLRPHMHAGHAPQQRPMPAARRSQLRLGRSCHRMGARACWRAPQHCSSFRRQRAPACST